MSPVNGSTATSYGNANPPGTLSRKVLGLPFGSPGQVPGQSAPAAAGSIGLPSVSTQYNCPKLPNVARTAPTREAAYIFEVPARVSTATSDSATAAARRQHRDRTGLFSM